MTRHCSRWMVVLCVVAALGLPSAVHGAAFTNGSFETGPVIPPGPGYTTLFGGDTSMPGWTVLSPSIDYVGSYWVAADGSYSLDLDGSGPGGGVEQTFDTTPGYQYVVHFDLAANPADCGATVKGLDVTATGNPTSHYTFAIDGHTTASMGWQLQTYTFIAAGPSTTLTFRSTDTVNACGPALDNVTVTAVPPVPALPPAASAALAALLAALGWIALGRRSAA